MTDGRLPSPTTSIREPPGPDRWKNRSRTYKAIAEAMAEQWGGYHEGGTPVTPYPIKDEEIAF